MYPNEYVRTFVTVNIRAVTFISNFPWQKKARAGSNHGLVIKPTYNRGIDQKRIQNSVGWWAPFSFSHPVVGYLHIVGLLSLSLSFSNSLFRRNLFCFSLVLLFVILFEIDFTKAVNAKITSSRTSNCDRNMKMKIRKT